MLQLELDDHLSGELHCEAERLGITPEQVALKAISAWMADMNDQEPDGHDACETVH